MFVTGLHIKAEPRGGSGCERTKPPMGWIHFRLVWAEYWVQVTIHIIQDRCWDLNNRDKITEFTLV